MSVLNEIAIERVNQDVKWGEQNHSNGTFESNQRWANEAKRRCEDAFSRGKGTWFHILDEEVQEAFAEQDPQKLRAELIQVAAVAVAWCEAIDRRSVNNS